MKPHGPDSKAKLNEFKRVSADSRTKAGHGNPKRTRNAHKEAAVKEAAARDNGDRQALPGKVHAVKNPVCDVAGIEGLVEIIQGERMEAQRNIYSVLALLDALDIVECEHPAQGLVDLGSMIHILKGLVEDALGCLDAVDERTRQIRQLC